MKIGAFKDGFPILLLSIFIAVLILINPVISWGASGFIANLSPALRITNTPSVSRYPAIAVDPSNNVYIAWAEGEMGFGWSEALYFIRLDPASPLQAPKSLSSGIGLMQGEPALATGPGNRLHISWHNWGTWNEEMIYRSVSKDGIIGNFSLMTFTNFTNTDVPRIKVDSANGIHIVYTSEHLSGLLSFDLFYKKFTYDPLTDTLKEVINPIAITQDGGIFQVCDIGLDSKGDVHIVWNDDGGVVNYTKLSGLDGHILIPKIEISYASSTFPAINIDRLDNVHIAWSQSGEIFYARLDNNGTRLSQNIRVTLDTAVSVAPGIVVDSSNNPHIAWVDTRDGVPELFYTMLSNIDGTKLLEDVRITENDGSESTWAWPSISIDPSDNIHIAWQDSRDQNQEIYYRTIKVERLIANIRLIDTISTSNIDLDSTSFTKTPASITVDTANNKTIIEWQYDSFSIGQIEDLSFDVILKNPIPGEDRIVNHKLELLYTDINGNPVRTELGPQSVHVLASAFTTTISTDKTSYNENENVLIDLAITNLSEFGRTIDAILEIKDSKDLLVTTVKTLSGISFTAGETKTFLDIIYNTGSTPAGDYSASVRLMEGPSQVGEAKTSFKILPSKSVTSKITSDKTSYSSNEQVTLTSTITSQSQNSTISKPSATVKIIDPNGITIYTETKNLPDLLPQSRYEFKSFTNTKTNPSGSYTATLEIREGVSLLSIASTGLTILSSLDQAKALSGTITVDPGTIFEKEQTTFAYTIHNTGNDIDLPIIQIEILIVDPDTGISVRTMFDETSLNGREIFANSILFDSKGLPPKSYLVVLRGITAGITQTLASTALIIVPIPNSAPIANAGPDQIGFTGQSANLDGTKSSDPDGDLITFSWHFTEVPQGSLITDASLSNSSGPTPSFIPDIEGIYILSLAVNDGLLSSQTDTVSVFVNPAPKAAIHPETINLKSNGGSKSITGILSSPLLSSFSFFTAQDGVTVTAGFTLENRYQDKDGNQVIFTIPQDDYPGDDYVMVFDSDGNGIDDTYTITLKFNRDLIIAGFKDQNGLLKISRPTDLISTIIGNGIRIGSDTNLVISPPEVK